MEKFAIIFTFRHKSSYFIVNIIVKRNKMRIKLRLFKVIIILSA